VLAVLVGLPRAAPAQTVTSHGTLPGAPCEYCHRPHSAADGPYTLLGDAPGSPPLAWLQTQAPGAGSPSATCLRCHWGEAHRRLQPDLPSPPLVWLGRYVGPDLGDDHFLGSLVTPAPVQRYEEWRVTGGAGSGRSELSVVECTLCHAVHDPGPGMPQPGEQYRFCGACHGSEASRSGGHAQITCRGCHRLHNSLVGGGLFHGATIEDTCTRCHASTDRILPDSLDYAVVGGGRPRVPAAHNLGSPCETCHTLHGAD
jgi:hypothetical protein